MGNASSQDIATVGSATGYRAVDISSTDVAFSAADARLLRGLSVAVAGLVKIDAFDSDGTTVFTGTVSCIAGPNPYGRITKVYKTGTTATGITALF